MSGVRFHGEVPRIDAFNAAMRGACERLAAGEPAVALGLLERAHVLGQRDMGRHLTVHWRMLRVGWLRRDGREMRGQLFRLLLTPFGHLTGRLPLGNLGSASVDAFAPMPMTAEIKRLLPDQNGR